MKLIPAAFLSLALAGCSVSNSEKEDLENILLEEMISEEVLEKELSQENVKLTESIKVLIGINEDVDLEQSLEYNLFKEKVYELKSKSSIEVLSFDKKNGTVVVNVSYIDIGEMLSNTFRNNVERAFVSHYKGEVITEEFYNSLFKAMNDELDSKENSLKWEEREVSAEINGDFDLEKNLEILTLGMSDEISSLIEHFEQLSIEKEFLDIQEKFNSIANLYDKSLSLEKNQSQLQKKGFKVDFQKEEKLKDTYYLKLNNSELTISKLHQGNEIFYKKEL